MVCRGNIGGWGKGGKGRIDRGELLRRRESSLVPATRSVS